ncbi:MAG TPA: hypothetical protein VMF90_14590, partial [Rhizobiaceae bacterium]|nr:hypothetical protein [Rhizobiaceae bacterium]
SGMEDEPTANEQLAQAKEALTELNLERSEIMVLSLGRSVIAWSYLERAVEHSLGILLTAHGVPFAESEIISTNVSLRDRVPLIATLAHRKFASAPWFDELIDLTNLASNELRNRRNRIVHDAWADDTGRLSRRSSSKPKLIRPQSRKYDLQIPGFEPVEFDSISSFITDCLAAANKLCKLNTKMVETAEKAQR